MAQFAKIGWRVTLRTHGVVFLLLRREMWIYWQERVVREMDFLKEGDG